MSVAFPPEIEAFVENSLASRTFASREELIITAIGLLREREAALAKLRADIEARWDGPGIPMEEAFAQLRARFGLPSAGDTDED